MSRSGTKNCGVCQTLFECGDCTLVDGQGTTDDPFFFTPFPNEIETNVFECGPAGMGAFVPGQYLDTPAVHVYSSVDWPVPFDSIWPITFDEIRYDTDHMYNAEDKDGKIVFNTPGVYLVTLNIRWQKIRKQGVFQGDFAAFIRKNNADFVGLDSFPRLTDNHSLPKSCVSAQIVAERGDYVSAWVKQDIELSGTPKDMTILAERGSPVFAATMLRPLGNMDVQGFHAG